MEKLYSIFIIIALTFCEQFALISALQQEVPLSEHQPSCDAHASSNTAPVCNFTTAWRDVSEVFPEVLLESSWSGDRVFKGNPTAFIDCDSCVFSVEYYTGGVFWSPSHGVKSVHNATDIWDAWKKINTTERVKIGYPVSDVIRNASQEYVWFNHGLISRYSEAFYGPIYDKWLASGGLRVLGFPSRIWCQADTEHLDVGLGAICRCDFWDTGLKQSRIEWIVTGRPYLVPGGLFRARFDQPSDDYGYAISDKLTTIGGTNYILIKQRKGVSAIFESNYGAWFVTHPILGEYMARGGPDGHLGPPSMSTWNLTWGFPRTRLGGYYQDFKNGSVYRSGPTTDKVYESRAPLAKPEYSGDLWWETAWKASESNITGRIKFGYFPFGSVWGDTSFQIDRPIALNYTIECALRDADGRVYSFGRTGFLNGTNFLAREEKKYWSARAVLFEDGQQMSADYVISWRALVFADALECQLETGAPSQELRASTVLKVRAAGPTIPFVYRLFETTLE
jgi:hypothetical protein